ncbi:SDR family NAD(P)-dependent oxidoreductase [Actinomadura sp. ATCC 31491]|uniref:SDR family NAD(P)-dependent oxidoreductase n=1 Tax=Actinomadura luzonensis TaxID=2805427 RepID=A0ABT0G3S4_9ACTN|nr:SDR family NAD(P)-dependent oxidoreductase [Actinomadura luzonensis]MCK2218776.1 SDR family NAD(P)-dependent oxidoreductase [Actinomadura luzonensis]
MTRSIAVFGTGPGVGQAVARRYGKEGYEVVLVARRREPLDRLARDLAAEGVTAHVITGDLGRSGDVPALAAQVRAAVGDPTAFYYGPVPSGLTFVPAVELTPGHLAERLEITLHTLLALVGEFLPAMAERGDGAILTAQGAAAAHGRPYMSGWPPVLAAQRNYLQSLAAEVAGQGVYVGMLYIGSRILGTSFDDDYRRRQARGEPVPDLPAADPADLADLLWSMHARRDRHETIV